VRDWPLLIADAGREGLAGLLAARLTQTRPSGVPPQVMDELERLRRLSAQRSLRMAGQLLRILEAFEQHGIEALPIKGPVLAQDVYGDPTVRMSCDLDILVRPCAAAAAHRVLLENGFEDEGHHSARQLRRLGRERELHLRRRGGEPMVDLHWRLATGYSPNAFDTDRVFSNMRIMTLLGREVPTLGRTDQFLLSILHGSKHAWQGLELRLAVAVQVAGMPPSAWPGLCARARRLGCLRRLAVGVDHACRPFPVAVPVEIQRLRARDLRAPSYERYLRGVAGGEVGCGGRGRSFDHLAALWWQVRSEDRGRDALESLALRIVLPSIEDWDAVALPERLEWLYWCLRPARLVAKYSRQVSRRA